MSGGAAAPFDADDMIPGPGFRSYVDAAAERSRPLNPITDSLARHGYEQRPIGGVRGVHLIVHRESGRNVAPMNLVETNLFLRALDFGLPEKSAKAMACDAQEHACSCGEPHPLVNGGNFIGNMDDGDGADLALFTCRLCGSTRAAEKGGAK